MNTKEIVEEILNKINEDAPHKIISGGIIKSGIDVELDELRACLILERVGYLIFKKLKESELNIPSLKVKFNKVFGYFIEVTKTHLDKKIPQSFNRKQTLVNSERYFIYELKEYEEKVLSAQSKILDIENRIFEQLNTYILSESKIYVSTLLINKLDLLSSFAEKAIKENYVRPNLSESQY